MTELSTWTTGRSADDATGRYGSPAAPNLADVLERVLDKGMVIAGDIKINLLDIELLTIKLRLLVASLDKAKEIGIDWWEHDPALSSSGRSRALEVENDQLRKRLDELEAAACVDRGAPQ
jgi:hypothetical protein